jgi:hypothetical protein
MEDSEAKDDEVKNEKASEEQTNDWCKRMDWCKNNNLVPSEKNNWEMAGLGVKYSMTWRELAVWTTQVQQWADVLGMNKRDIIKFVDFLNNEVCKTNETAVSQGFISDVFEFLFGDKDSSPKGGCCGQN